MLIKTNKQSATIVVASALSTALVLAATSGVNAQSRGTFDNGDGTMGYTVNNNGRTYPVVGNAGAGRAVAPRQLPAAARSSFAAQPGRPGRR